MNRWTTRSATFPIQAKMRIYILVAVAVSHAAVAETDTQRADDGDSIKYYAADMETYDSNLYRLPSSISDITTVAGPSAARDDLINTGYVGIDAKWYYGKQGVTLNLRADENRFTHNSNLNNSAGNANLNWNWALGSRLSGQAGADYTRALASFIETLYLGRDLVTTTDEFATGRFELGPHWTLIGDVRNAEATHGANAASSNNFRSQSGTIGLELATDFADTLTSEYHYSKAEFPDGIFIFESKPFDRDYEEDTVSVIVKHSISDKTQINSSVGYDRRQYTRESVGAFSGVIWRVTTPWQVTEKSQIVGAVWRDLEAYLASQSNYFVSTGISLSPTWTASERISLSLTFSSIRQHYIPSSPIVATLGTRNDRLSDEQATVTYSATRNLMFSFSFHNEQRASNEALFQFNDRLATATVTFTF